MRPLNEEKQVRVQVHREDGAYRAEVSELPGCSASGRTVDELWDDLHRAMTEHLSTPESVVTVEVEKPPPARVEDSETVETLILVTS